MTRFCYGAGLAALAACSGGVQAGQSTLGWVSRTVTRRRPFAETARIGLVRCRGGSSFADDYYDEDDEDDEEEEVVVDEEDEEDEEDEGLPSGGEDDEDDEEDEDDEGGGYDHRYRSRASAPDPSPPRRPSPPPLPPPPPPPPPSPSAASYASTNSEQPPQQQGMQWMITQKMRVGLLRLRYTSEEVAAMDPRVAKQVLQRGLPRPRYGMPSEWRRGAAGKRRRREGGSPMGAVGKLLGGTVKLTVGAVTLPIRCAFWTGKAVVALPAKHPSLVALVAAGVAAVKLAGPLKSAAAKRKAGAVGVLSHLVAVPGWVRVPNVKNWLPVKPVSVSVPAADREEGEEPEPIGLDDYVYSDYEEGLAGRWSFPLIKRLRKS